VKSLVGMVALAGWLAAGGAARADEDTPRGRVEALAARVALAVDGRLHGQVELRSAWDDLDGLGWLTSADAGALHLRFHRRGEAEPFAVYALAPWQPLFARPAEEAEPPGPGAPPPAEPAELLGVTAEAMVFKAAQAPVADPAGPALRGEVGALVEAALGLGAVPPAALALPEPLTLEGMRVVSVRRYPHRLCVALELEGGPPPTPEGLVRAMRGPWVLDAALATGRGPARRWLLPPSWAELEPGDAPRPAPAGPAEPVFPGYQPKTSPDTPLDFRPSLAPRFAALPPATSEAVPRLLLALEVARAAALARPGAWVAGNPILGASPREWAPSDEELVEAELGRRLEAALGVAAPEALRRALERAGERRAEIVYRAIEITHADVMGSGRYFYASEPRPRALRLRP